MCSIGKIRQDVHHSKYRKWTMIMNKSHFVFEALPPFFFFSSLTAGWSYAQPPLVVCWALNEGWICILHFVPPYVPLNFFNASRVQPSQPAPSRSSSIPGMDLLRTHGVLSVCPLSANDTPLDLCMSSLLQGPC